VTLDHLTQKYSQRLGVLTAAQFQAALDRFRLGQLLDATPAPGGIFGQNVLLTSSEGQFVFRGCPHYAWQLAKESFFAYLIQERTEVVAPWPYLIDESTDIFGWQYALMPRLPGLQLGDKSLRAGFSESDRVAIAAALGRCLAQLHELKWPFFGESDEKGNITPAKISYRDWILANAERRIARASNQAKGFTEPDEAWCRDVLAEDAHALDVPFEPGLVHHDFKEGNVVVQPEGRGWEVSGVFDLMECYFGHPEEDFVRSIWGWEQERPGSPLPSAFIEAYASINRLSRGYRERYRVNMLRETLLMWEFGHRDPVPEIASEPWPDPDQTYRAFAEPYVMLGPFS
jgi:aminoglycoside phosphotransferase (APT) family kinase protein